MRWPRGGSIWAFPWPNRRGGCWRPARLAGRPAVSATLSGAGSLDGWSGELTATAEGLATLDAAVDLALGPRLTITL